MRVQELIDSRLITQSSAYAAPCTFNCGNYFNTKAALTTATKLQQNCNKTKIKLKHKTVVLTSATKLQQNVKLF
jgi:hypothetical protein